MEDVYSQMHEGKQVLFTPDFIPIEQRVKMFENEDYAAKTMDEEVTACLPASILAFNIGSNFL